MADRGKSGGYNGKANLIPMDRRSKEEAIELKRQELSSEIEKDIANKENIQNVIVDTNELEGYVEVCVTYEVLENIENYEKLEF